MELKYKLNNVTTFKGNKKTCYFINDDILIEVSGEDSKIISKIISFLKDSEKSLDKIYKEFKNISKSKLLDCISLMSEYGFLSIKNQDIKTVKISIISNSINNIKVIKDVFSKKQSNNILYKFIESHKYNEINLSQIKNADLVIFTDSLFDNYDEVIYLNNELFNNDIPSVYFSTIKQKIIEIGPLTDKKLQTPCLESFLKRKISNLKNPNIFVNVMNYQKDQIRTTTNENIIKMGCYLLKNELDSYFMNNFSNLLGSYFEFDTHSFEVSKNLIIKVHNLSYESTPIISPYN
jgi:hypothetical protein